MDKTLEKSLRTMTAAVADQLGGRVHSIWLYGSVVLNDFRPGWSDIDWLVLTQDPLTEDRAASLLDFRQAMSREVPDNPHFRCFEGIITGVEEFHTRRFRRLVYWGTTGQRVTDRYEPDPFALLQLATQGVPLRGDGDRRIFVKPDPAEIRFAIRRHLETIRSCAEIPDPRLYSCGWLLDIARCLYTLQTGAIAAKTFAGYWALENHLFPPDTEEALRWTLTLREHPLLFKDNRDVKQWLASLGPTVWRCAAVLAEALQKAEEAGGTASGAP